MVLYIYSNIFYIAIDMIIYNVYFYICWYSDSHFLFAIFFLIPYCGPK